MEYFLAHELIHRNPIFEAFRTHLGIVDF